MTFLSAFPARKYYKKYYLKEIYYIFQDTSSSYSSMPIVEVILYKGSCFLFRTLFQFFQQANIEVILNIRYRSYCIVHCTLLSALRTFQFMKSSYMKESYQIFCKKCFQLFQHSCP